MQRANRKLLEKAIIKRAIDSKLPVDENDEDVKMVEAAIAAENASAKAQLELMVKTQQQERGEFPELPDQVGTVEMPIEPFQKFLAYLCIKPKTTIPEFMDAFYPGGEKLNSSIRHSVNVSATKALRKGLVTRVQRTEGGNDTTIGPPYEYTITSKGRESI